MLSVNYFSIIKTRNVIAINIFCLKFRQIKQTEAFIFQKIKENILFTSLYNLFTKF